MEHCGEKEFDMSGFLAPLWAIGLMLVPPVAPAVAMPAAPAVETGRMPYVIDAQVLCDYRGCFGFGPTQWYRRPTQQPSYLPPNSPPVYYRPRAVGVPDSAYYRNVPPPAPQAPQARQIYRQPAEGTSRHVAWCLDRYRSYNPETNRYMQTSGRYHECVSPYD